MLPARRKPLVISEDGISSATRDHLRLCLELSVPIWIEKLRHQPTSYLLERARVCGQVVAERGDIIQFRSKTKGASGEAFSRLAEGLACLALTAQGGVTFLGLTFCREQRERPDHS